MALMTNGKKVAALALGGTEFYSMKENADGSIFFNGEVYSFGNKASDSIGCAWVARSGTTPYGVTISLSQKLNSGSAPTVKDLIDKGEKIRLTVSFHNNADGYNPSLVSGIIDLSKPDSNGHFNFQWLNGATSTNTYCYSNSGARDFGAYSDAINAYSSNTYDTGHMVITYNELFIDAIANPPTSFSPPINTYSISVADSSFAVTTLSQITSSLNDSIDGVVLGSDGEQYLHLSNSDCFVKLSDATDEKDTQIGQEVNLTIGAEAYNLNYSNHKYTFTDQGTSIGINHPEAIMNARFMVNGTQYYHTNVTGYGRNWFKK